MSKGTPWRKGEVGRMETDGRRGAIKDGLGQVETLVGLDWSESGSFAWLMAGKRLFYANPLGSWGAVEKVELGRRPN